MHSTPKRVAIYDKAYVERIKLADMEAHRNSYYIFEGVSLALSNAFRKKGHKPKDYFDVFKKPILQMTEEPDGMTESEKRKKTELLFKNLEIQMANFNLAKMQKERNDGE